jgi:hypothetical protein
MDAVATLYCYEIMWHAYLFIHKNNPPVEKVVDCFHLTTMNRPHTVDNFEFASDYHGF